jgi:hypothetical protein
MSDRIDRQFDEADAAVTQAVTRFASEIQSMFGKWEAVAPSYIIQNMLLELSTEVSKLAHEAKDVVEPETLKLLEAMDEYRDV